MNNYSGNETVNAGTGKELTIKELTELIAKVVGYTGEILWDTTKPNGTPRKLLDVSKSRALGWSCGLYAAGRHFGWFPPLLAWENHALKPCLFHWFHGF